MFLLLDKLDAECSKLCQRNDKSAFRNIPVSQMSAFDWKPLTNELELKAPMLLQILRTLASSKDHRNKRKSDSAHYPGICTAASVILKERNREMCGIQSVVSLLLFSSHANKQVKFYTVIPNVHMHATYFILYIHTCTGVCKAKSCEHLCQLPCNPATGGESE